jgi:hypothetical protein
MMGREKEKGAPTKAAQEAPAKAHNRTALGGAPLRERPSTASVVERASRLSLAVFPEAVLDALQCVNRL